MQLAASGGRRNLNVATPELLTKESLTKQIAGKHKLLQPLTRNAFVLGWQQCQLSSFYRIDDCLVAERGSASFRLLPVQEVSEFFVCLFCFAAALRSVFCFGPSQL